MGQEVAEEVEEDAIQPADHRRLRKQKVAGEEQAGDAVNPVVLARLIQLSCTRDYMCRFGEASEVEAAMAVEAM